jgi:EmrB/QacA subfamily drug resistance transporter
MSEAQVTAGAAWDEPVTDVSRRPCVLAVLLVGAFMILLDVTIVNVAVPSIQRSLQASYGAVEWVVSGYALAYGLLLIPAGRLGDRFGHKRVLLVGLAGFTLTSVLAGTATTAGELIGLRVAQGAMAGVMNSPILALIQVIFPPRERGKAFGWYGAIAGVSTALGPLLGGLLIAWNLHGWDWRPVFFVNLPIGFVALVATVRLVPESRAGHAERLDLPGVALVSAGIVAIIYPLIAGQAAGWPIWSFVVLAASIPILASFALWERRLGRHGKTPLVNVALFANRSFTAGAGVSLVYFAGFIGLLFALSLHFQIGLGWTALHAGLTLLPFAGGTFVGASFSDPIAKRLHRGVLLLGSGVVAVSVAGVVAVIHYQGVGVTTLGLLAPLLVGGIGSGLVIAPNTDIVLAGVPWQEAGSASGVLNTSQRIGQAIGIATVGAALFGVLGAGAAHASKSAAVTLGHQLKAAGLNHYAVISGTARFTRCFRAQSASPDPTATPPGCHHPVAHGPIGTAYLHAANGALAADFTHAIQIAALVALAAVVITYLLVYLLPRSKQQQDWSG